MKQKAFANNRKGIFVPVVIAAILLFGMYVGTLMFASRGELHMLSKRIRQERARNIAESAIEIGRSLIFQNKPTERWFKQKPLGPKRFGYKGTMKGKLGGGSFLLVAEDVCDGSKMVNEAMSNFSPDPNKSAAENQAAQYSWISAVTYKRMDLFAEGRYEDAKVIVHKRLYWFPPQKVFEWDEVESYDATTNTTGIKWTNIRQR